MVDLLLNMVVLEGLVYIIYILGMIGNLKGVLIIYVNLCVFFCVMEFVFKFNEDDFIVFFYFYVFDFLVWEMWLVLVYGGKFVILDNEICLIFSKFV